MARKILLNPGPGTTSESVKQALLVDDICPREQEFGTLLADINQGLLKIGQAEERFGVALFASSGTGAVEAMLTSAVHKNDHVLILTNGAYSNRMKQVCDSYDIPHSTLFSFGERIDLELLEEKLRSDDSISHLAITHHETATGMLNPLEEISDLCEKTNITLLVDAMSTFGAVPIPLDELNISYICASSNKCIQGMAGLSFVLFDKDRLNDDLAQKSPNFYFDVRAQYQYFQEKGQLRYTPPVQICYAFKQAIDETLNETVEKRRERYSENWSVLYDGLQELGFEPFLDRSDESEILLALKLEGQLPKGFDHFHDYLYERNITVYPGKIPETNTFRVAVIGDLRKEDLEFAVGKIGEYLESL
jgi:2-aminoethylphosphonate-pyruvate transaminase